MGEFSYAQPDFAGYGDLSLSYSEPSEATSDGPLGYEQEVASLVPEGIPMLAAVLHEKGVLTDETLHLALARQAETGDSLAQVLLEGGWAAPDQLVEALQIRASYA